MGALLAVRDGTTWITEQPPHWPDAPVMVGLDGFENRWKQLGEKWFAKDFSAVGSWRLFLEDDRTAKQPHSRLFARPMQQCEGGFPWS